MNKIIKSIFWNWYFIMDKKGYFFKAKNIRILGYGFRSKI
jgi:hypothetical protein